MIIIIFLKCMFHVRFMLIESRKDRKNLGVRSVRISLCNKKDANSVIGVFQEVLIKLYYIPILLYIEGQDDIY